MAFLENSKVLLNNNQYIDIKDLFRNMKVIGAKGEINTVLGRARRLLRSKTRNFIKINNKLTITTERVLVGPQGLYVGNTTHFALCNTPRPNLNEDGETWLMEDFVEVFLSNNLSLEEGRGKSIYANNERWLEKPYLSNLITQLELGTVLYGENEELITVNKIEELNVDPDAIIYIPITNGSTSYIVDGFAVCGWLREDCFDYNIWNKIKDIDYNHVALSNTANGGVIIIDSSLETERLF